MDEFLAHYDVYYDDQCEVCQAGVSWLRFLDRRGRVRPIALSSAPLSGGLLLEDCLRELHVVPPTETLAGWDAVARLARLFAWTWPIGAMGAIPPFSWLGRILYRYIARNRYAVSRRRGGVCGSAKPAQVRGRARLGDSLWNFALNEGRAKARRPPRRASGCFSSALVADSRPWKQTTKTDRVSYGHFTGVP